jgi:AbiV family abortive infection protein
MVDRRYAFYENVLALEPPHRIKVICDGIKTILDHIPSLLDDADLLFEHERYATAQFVVVTADEELGKLHILIDAARLGAPHKNTAMRLGVAFYSHVAKYAYSEVWRARRDLEEGTYFGVEQRMDINLVKHWPDTKDKDGQLEPGTPHDTKVQREMRLYVDYQDYGGGWIVPRGYRDEFESLFRGVPALRERSRKHLKAFQSSRDLGLFEVGPMLKFSEMWRGSYFGRAANEDKRRQLTDLRKKTATAIAELAGCEAAIVRDSPLCFWPCYDFLDGMASDGPSETLLRQLVAPRIGYP